MSLNPQQFFHGTTHAIKDTHVRPGWDVDKDPSEYSMGDPGDMSEGDHAFVSEDEHHAWRIANTVRQGPGRPRVYSTGDAPDKKPGPWNPQHPNFLEHAELDHPDPQYAPTKDQIHEEIMTASLPEWGSKTGFPVRERIDIMPGHQGTFPNINWKRYSEGITNASANHPNDTMVQYGSLGLKRSPHERVHAEAIKDNEAFNQQKPGLKEPSRRTGAALKAYMRGEPDPGPLADHPRLF